MKILVSTSLTQGTRPNDFCFVPEEEIVRFGVEHPGEEVDSICGCRRAMHGINTDRATTTFKVVETLLIREEFRRLIATSFRNAYSRQAIHRNESDLTDECAELMADFILSIAAEFQVGQILERRGGAFFVREDDWDDLIEE